MYIILQYIFSKKFPLTDSQNIPFGADNVPNWNI